MKIIGQVKARQQVATRALTSVEIAAICDGGGKLVREIKNVPNTKGAGGAIPALVRTTK